MSGDYDKVYAHSGNPPQELWEHLQGVAHGAERFAREALPGDDAFAAAARAAGLLHDLRKYRSEFQQKLKGLNPPREKTYHKQADAAKAADAGNGPVAFPIAGHHGGIPNMAHLKSLIAGPAGRAVVAAIWGEAVRDCPELGDLSLISPPLHDKLSADLLTRLLFGCLVDADWIDTGEHERRSKGLPPEPPAPALEPATRLECVLAHIRTLASECKEPYIAELRAHILNDCLAAADVARAPRLVANFEEVNPSHDLAVVPKK